jgi:hypothetical protein
MTAAEILRKHHPCPGYPVHSGSKGAHHGVLPEALSKEKPRGEYLPYVACPIRKIYISTTPARFSEGGGTAYKLGFELLLQRCSFAELLPNKKEGRECRFSQSLVVGNWLREQLRDYYHPLQRFPHTWLSR